MDEFFASSAKLNRVSIDFLKTDMATLLIFTRSALNTDNREKRSRNRQVADKGYKTILRLMKKVKLTQDDADFFSKKLRQLKSELRMLGEIT